MSDVPAETLGQLFEGVGLVLWQWDARSDHIDWWGPAEQTIGLPLGVISSWRVLSAAVHPADLSLLRGALEEARKTRGRVSARYRLDTQSGWRRFDVTYAPLLGEAGELLGATGTLSDVSEDGEAEEAVLAALRDAETLLDHIQATSWEWHIIDRRLRYSRLDEGEGSRMRIREMDLAEVVERLGSDQMAKVLEALNAAWGKTNRFCVEVTLRAGARPAERVIIVGRTDPASNSVRGTTIRVPQSGRQLLAAQPGVEVASATV